MKNLVSINDLPPAGKEFSLDNQEIWKKPIEEFKMDCRIDKPLRITFFVMPAENGVLVRGELTGGVVLPCNRCTEDAETLIDSRFDEFEEIPETPPRTQNSEEDHILFERNAPMLNLDAVAWEQFMLALPTNPLCKEDCKGLCGKCGANLNNGQCDCENDNPDPRLAALRDLKVDR